MPSVKIIGVHPLDVSEELHDQAVTAQHGLIALDLDPERRERALAMTNASLASVVLVELIVVDRERHMYMGDFGQSAAGDTLGPDDEVAYGEVFLNATGDERAANHYEDLEGPDARIAFYLHAYRPRRPILTPYGPVDPPLLTPTPYRLARLVPYEPR
ncbi:MAG TPA: hypothetical protein P5081_23720 [Phycisphaerae bacterium]|nr:hypothetical protein [Phycisphaerae bacterium]HRW55893.1 hypothetical protein [Phycisphaerae bacterium]